MTENHWGSILESVLSANPKYELVLFDRLPAEQREMLKELRKDPGFYGILRPLDKPGLGVKSVSRDTALLFLTLQQPSRLPEYVRDTLGERCHQEITRLILDGVLALEHDGNFLSGPDAAALIYAGAEDLPSPVAAEGYLERLSLEALRYGQSLGLSDRAALSTRLYGYNRTPLSPHWKRTLRDEAAAAAYLGIREGRNRERLEREWSSVRNPASNDGWLAWQSRRPGSGGPTTDENPIGCKLYISPATERLPEAFPAVLAVLGRTRVRHFKVGKDAPGLLRPDKLVAYFSRYQDLAETAEQLKQELGGCAPHGVPFTAELAGDGLLSWGIDPPADEQALPWIGRESWRLWVTNRLAVALIAARTEASSHLEPWQFALRRLQIEGVDTRSWIPAGTDNKGAVGV
ncbi:MAG TPA: hypothetical protein VMU45_02365 [Candidatus Eisenbacteria bacterium]|nr:hypothetical protein [Candidatus Eisenbacteria bacterium]